MSVRTQVLVTKNTATSAINRFVARFGLKRVQNVVGPAVTRLTQRHLRGLGQNKRGWPSTGFYADAIKKTDWQPESDGVLLSVNKIGMRQRFHGGTIRPVNARALTIPTDADSYGKVPSDFPDLFLIKGKGLLARTIGKGKNARLQVLFKLSGGVTQEGDPNVMPSREALMAAAKSAILESGN